jgi:hypothetical protein
MCVYVHVWKHYNEIPCTALLNKQKCLLKIENRVVKEVMSYGWFQWEGGEHKKRVYEDECSENIMYSCMEMRHLETITVMWGEGGKENDGGGEFKYNIL